MEFTCGSTAFSSEAMGLWHWERVCSPDCETLPSLKPEALQRQALPPFKFHITLHSLLTPPQTHHLRTHTWVKPHHPIHILGKHWDQVHLTLWYTVWHTKSPLTPFLQKSSSPLYSLIQSCGHILRFNFITLKYLKNLNYILFLNLATLSS